VMSHPVLTQYNFNLQQRHFAPDSFFTHNSELLQSKIL
jgi:hypothetical protein